MSGLGNTTRWGDFLPGGVAGETFAGGLDTTEVIDNLLPTLHASSRSDDDLTFWSEADLIQWLDAGAKRLARVACVFVGRDDSTLTVPGQAGYALPVRHLSTLDVSYEGTSTRAANQLELEARNTSYQTVAGTPDHWYEDLLGTGTLGLTPVPNAQGALTEIYEGWPETLDAGKQNTLVAAPAPVKGYLSMYLLAEAYGKEGEMEAPDIAAHCRDRVKMYEQIFQGYYGPGM